MNPEHAQNCIHSFKQAPFSYVQRVGKRAKGLLVTWTILTLPSLPSLPTVSFSCSAVKHLGTDSCKYIWRTQR